MVTNPSAIDFSPYLQSILDDEDYREWQDLYTPTTVEGKKQTPQPKFSPRLKLRVATVEPREEERDSENQREQVEQWEALAGLRQYARDHVLLIGKPGSGKSTSLQRLLWEDSDNALSHPDAKIPVLVKLRRCTSTIEKLIQDFLSRHQLSLTVAEIENLLNQGKLMLLLDGLNELPEAFRTTLINFRDKYRSTAPMVFSTRDLGIGGTLDIKKTLKMLPLTEPQMQEFVQGYLGEEGNQLFQQLKGDRLRKFAETPLLLWMLCRVFAQNGQVPANLGLAFREFTQLYDQQIQEDAPAESREQWPKLLRHLAFALMHDKEPVGFRLSMSKEEAETLLTEYLQQEDRTNARDCAESWLQDLLDYHLIQPVIQPNYEEHIEFRHQLIQEYYAAEYLLRLLPKLSDEQLKRDYLNLLKWTEAIALLLGLLGKKNQALQIVKLALDVDLRLGARLAGEVTLVLQKATVNEVIALSVSDWLKVELLGRTRSGEAIPSLCPFLEHPNIDVAKDAAFFIGETHDQAAINILEKRLEKISNDFFSQKWYGGADKTGDLWTTHVEALSFLSPKSAAQFLRRKLEENSTVVQTITDATPILMRLDATRIIPELLEEFRTLQAKETKKISAGWKQPEEEIQLPDLMAFEVPWEIASIDKTCKKPMRFTPPSPECLRRSDILNLFESYLDYKSSVSSNILNLLENNLEDKLLVPFLIQSFELEPHERIKVHIIQLVSKSKDAASINFLIQTLGKHNTKLRSEATKQLLKLKSINDPKSIEELRDLAKHQDWNISWWAAFVLGHLKDSTVLQRMMDELENHQTPSIRSDAAKVLGIIGEPNCIPSLLKAMNHDSDRYVRLNAACSLSFFKQKEAIPTLINSLKSLTNADPHAHVMKSAARFGLQEALLEIIKSKRFYWQRAAIELGNLAKS